MNWKSYLSKGKHRANRQTAKRQRKQWNETRMVERAENRGTGAETDPTIPIFTEGFGRMGFIAEVGRGFGQKVHSEMGHPTEDQRNPSHLKKLTAGQLIREKVYEFIGMVIDRLEVYHESAQAWSAWEATAPGADDEWIELLRCMKMKGVI